MTKDEIKIRQLTNQYLITPAEKITVVRDLCGIQSQFMVNAIHSLKIRCSDFDEINVKTGLVKNWTVRGTIHVFAEDDLALFKHCNNGKDYRNDEYLGYSAWKRADGTYLDCNDGSCEWCWALSPERQKMFSHIILDSLKYGEKTRDELKSECRNAGMTELEESAMFDQWGGGIRDMCERGFMNYVVQEKKAYCLSPEFDPIPEEDAKLELARRYFTNFSPATIHDAMYYFHVSAAQVKEWLSKLPVASVECEGKTYYYIENGKSYDKDIPRCILLAGFDQLMLGYEKKESLYLKNENMRAIFNLAGIVMPAVMIDGEVVGKWKKKNKKLSISLFKKQKKADIKIIEEQANKLWNDIKCVEYSEIF